MFGIKKTIKTLTKKISNRLPSKVQAPSPLAIYASGVLGQNSSFATRISNYPSGAGSARGMFHPGSAALDTVYHRLFVSDIDNHRVLVFQLDDNNSIVSDIAINVLGKPDLTTVSAMATPYTISNIGGMVFNLCLDEVNQRLFVAQGFANPLGGRITCYDVHPSRITNGANALFILGQPDFDSHVMACTRSGCVSPDDMDYDPINERVFVSDEMNYRVLCYSVPANAGSEINGSDALFVLGQADFTSKVDVCNQSGLGMRPTGIAYDPVNERLFVGDLDNNRMMCFKVPSNAGTEINGENALFVIGQPNFTTKTTGRARNRTNGVDDCTYDPVSNILMFSDSGNTRVLVFYVPDNAGIEFNGSNAMFVVGQPDFTSLITGCGQNCFGGGGVYGIECPHTYDPVNSLFYSYDYYNNRVALFYFIKITTAALTDGMVGKPYSQKINFVNQQGVQQVFKIAKGPLPDGLVLDANTGIISGVPTVSGSFAFTLEVDDIFAGAGMMFHRKTYSVNVVD
ncbi:MAG TPA: putative Ig domain-containing protein [Syntrophomonadaceae bacterium]|nr:putative Ig domain-containing protein [Syntrophomonadaceae bacterium]